MKVQATWKKKSIASGTRLTDNRAHTNPNHGNAYEDKTASETERPIACNATAGLNLSLNVSIKPRSLSCLTQQFAWADVLAQTLEDKVLFSNLTLYGAAGKPQGKRASTGAI